MKRMKMRGAWSALIMLLAISNAAWAVGYVEKYEQMLTELGYKVGAVDDVFDLALDKGVREFQVRNGLEVNGELSQVTRDAIEQAYGIKYGLLPKVVRGSDEPAAVPAPVVQPTYQPQVRPTYAVATPTRPACDCTCPPPGHHDVMPMDAKRGAKPTSRRDVAKPAQPAFSYRLSAQWQGFSKVYDDTINEFAAYVEKSLLSAEFQSPMGLYLGVTSGRREIKEIEINNVVTKVDDSENLWAASLGYRMPLNGEHQYLGLAYSYSDVADFTTSSLSVFTEKDSAKRLGRVTYSLNSSDDEYTLSIAGSHYWFLGAGHFGLGLNWMIAGGQTDTGSSPEADIGMAGVGAQLMYRF